MRGRRGTHRCAAASAANLASTALEAAVAAAASPLQRSCHRCVRRSTVTSATVPVGLASTSRSSCAPRRRRQRRVARARRDACSPRVSRVRLRTTLPARSASCCVSSSCMPAAAVSEGGLRPGQPWRARPGVRGECSDVRLACCRPTAHHDAGHIRAEHVGVDAHGAQAFCEPGVPGFAHHTRLHDAAATGALSRRGACPNAPRDEAGAACGEPLRNPEEEGGGGRALTQSSATGM